MTARASRGTNERRCSHDRGTEAPRPRPRRGAEDAERSDRRRGAARAALAVQSRARHHAADSLLAARQLSPRLHRLRGAHVGCDRAARRRAAQRDQQAQEIRGAAQARIAPARGIERSRGARGGARRVLRQPLRDERARRERARRLPAARAADDGCAGQILRRARSRLAAGGRRAHRGAALRAAVVLRESHGAAALPARAARRQRRRRARRRRLDGDEGRWADGSVLDRLDVQESAA